MFLSAERREPKARGNVGREDSLQSLVIELVRIANSRDSGIIDQYVEPSEFLDRSARQTRGGGIRCIGVIEGKGIW